MGADRAGVVRPWYGTSTAISRLCAERKRLTSFLPGFCLNKIARRGSKRETLRRAPEFIRERREGRLISRRCHIGKMMIKDKPRNKILFPRANWLTCCSRVQCVGSERSDANERGAP